MTLYSKQKFYLYYCVFSRELVCSISFTIIVGDVSWALLSYSLSFCLFAYLVSYHDYPLQARVKFVFGVFPSFCESIRLLTAIKTFSRPFNGTIR